MLTGKKISSMNLDKESLNALKEISENLDMSQSAIVRFLVKGAYKVFQQDRTLPTWGYRQLELKNDEG